MFYAFYLLVMRRTTFFRLNRALLLSGSYLCLLLPLIRLRRVEAAGLAVASELTMVGVGSGPVGQSQPAAFPWATVLMALYAAGAIVTLVLYLISAVKMRRLIKSGETVVRDGCRLVVLDRDVPSFSWDRTVVIGRKDLQQNPAIFTHEQMHVRCRHSLDLLLFLPIQMLFWWNPLVWITSEELRLVHEYEADEGVLNNGIDATQYQLLLVRKAVGEQRFSLASGFQHAKLKNRITMMLKSNSSGWMRWSYLALVPVLLAFMFACNPAKKNAKNADAGEAADGGVEVVAYGTGAASDVQTPNEAADEASGQEGVPFALVENKPVFNGGDANEFPKWVNSNLKYPEQAIQDKVQGRVIVQFTIGADGAVRNVEVLRGVREDLDAEAVRVVSSSPKWEPATQNGEPVPVVYTFPIVYKLR
ncbi:MAG: TonB family protein [Bacteroidales bacterium]|nr:TonB family protein [Bacteroidales bacterium]